MSQAGIVDIEGTHPQIPTEFVCNVGSAVPIANVLEILGSAVAAAGIPLETVGSGNTVSIQVQYASAQAASSGTHAGVASFSSTQFSVDANGFVTLNGSMVAETITGNTGGALSPVAGNWNIFGTSVVAGTTPVQTSGTGNTLTVQVQRAQAIASTNATNVGLAAFNSAQFTVDSNGFVSINGSAIGETITGNTGGALSPTAGNWNILGTSTAAGTTPVQTSGSGSTLTVQVQKAQAIATTNATNVGLAAFSSAQFSVDANGFVTLNGSAVGETITGNTGGALSPTAGNWNILGTSTAPGTTPVQTSGSGSTLTVQVQKAQAIASTNATNVGLAAFNSSFFTVDSNGFVSLNGSGVGETITGDSGGALSPTAGNWNIIAGVSSQHCGSSVQFSGSGSTLELNVTDSNSNTIIGLGAGNASISGTNNAGFGRNVFSPLTTGSQNASFGLNSMLSITQGSTNSAFGKSALQNTTTGSNNTALGGGSLGTLITGSQNTAVGYLSAANYVGSESNNIIIGNSGTAAESNVIRIGTQGSGSGQQNQCFIAGIEGVSVSNKNYVTINTSTGQLGSEASTSLFSVNVQVFFYTGSTQTYTPTSGMVSCIIEAVGGGGGGGGAATSGAGNIASAAGGGAGGYTRGVFSAATIGASQSITIGAAGTAGAAGANNGGSGGTTSIGALMTAVGGTGGNGSGAGTVTASIGGSGGAGTGGNFSTQGTAGGWGWGSFAGSIVSGGFGGSSFFGGGGGMTADAAGHAGQAAVSYGGGGGGATTFQSAAAAGGAGAAGIVTVTEYVIN